MYFSVWGVRGTRDGDNYRENRIASDGFSIKMSMKWTRCRSRERMTLGADKISVVVEGAPGSAVKKLG